MSQGVSQGVRDHMVHRAACAAKNSMPHHTIFQLKLNYANYPPEKHTEYPRITAAVISYDPGYGNTSAICARIT